MKQLKAVWKIFHPIAVWLFVDLMSFSGSAQLNDRRSSPKI